MYRAIIGFWQQAIIGFDHNSRTGQILLVYRKEISAARMEAEVGRVFPVTARLFHQFRGANNVTAPRRPIGAGGGGAGAEG